MSIIIAKKWYRQSLHDLEMAEKILISKDMI